MNCLKAFLSGVLLWGICHQLFSQQVWFGTFNTVKAEHIAGVSLSKLNCNQYTLSDIEGELALRAKNKEEISILLQTPECRIGVDSLASCGNNSQYSSFTHHFGFITTMAVEGMTANFSKFESAIGSYNTDFMSGDNVSLNFEFAVTYKRFMTGVGFGFFFLENLKNDSLKVKFNTTQYNLDFGFKVFNSKRLTVSPLIGLKWKRYRLKNSDINRKIPLESYLSDKDLDIRFNQTYTSAGLRIEYIPKKQDLEIMYFTVGVDGGFILPLNKVPWTYSRYNRLVTDTELGIDNYFLRFFIAFVIV